jgi:hypothetical protein
MSQSAGSARDPKASPARDQDCGVALQYIADALRGLQFGTLTIVVQDGIPIQLERTEKRRLRRPVPKN